MIPKDFNQDETSIPVGGEKEKVLSEVGTTDVIYNNSSSSRDHVTASYTVSVAGECIGVRLLYKLKRNVAIQHLKNLPTNGRSGEWKIDISDNGYVMREVFMDILKYLDSYVSENNIT